MNKLFTVAIAVALLFVGGCTSLATSTVNLSKDESAKAQSIAERRQQIGFERVEAQNQFQAKMNSLAEREGTLNLEAGKLCFAFKRAHKLPPNANYTLDEWNGVLIKQ